MSQQKGQALQDPFLNILRKEHVPVSIFLVNALTRKIDTGTCSLRKILRKGSCRACPFCWLM